MVLKMGEGNILSPGGQPDEHMLLLRITMVDGAQTGGLKNCKDRTKTVQQGSEIGDSSPRMNTYIHRLATE